jgi:hypothetical protein
VTSVNEETCQSGKCDQHAPGEVFYTEIGVTFDEAVSRGSRITWFLPQEMVPISEQQYEGERLGVLPAPQTSVEPRRRARGRR